MQSTLKDWFPSASDEELESVEAFLQTEVMPAGTKYTKYAARIARATSAFLQGDYRGTIQHLGGCADANSLIMRATAQTRLEEFDAAWETLERIARMYPEHPELKTLQLMVSGSAGRLGKHCGADVGRALMREIRDHQGPYNHISQAVQSHFRNGRLAEGYSICLDFLSGYKGGSYYLTQGAMIPHWDGRQVSSLLIVGLFGFGDQIQYARFIRYARSKAKHITLAVPPQLVRLFADCGADVVVRNDVPLDIQAEAYVLCFWFLPALLGIHHYGETPYLRAPSTLKRSRALQVGLCWTAGPIDISGRSAALTDCEALRTVRRVEWHSLVPSSGSTWMRIHNPKDFADTAGIVAGLDLVITVDTSVAHLAGAMGRPVWVLLPTDGDWRWGADETTTPLYPSARLFRRRADESWRRLIDRVRSVLKTEALQLRDERR